MNAATHLVDAATNAALLDAVRDDHWCEDAGCDVATACANGYGVAAAFLLQGATECETVTAVWCDAGLDFRDVSDSADWRDWCEHADQYGVRCDACGSFTYGDDYYRPETCANCRASLPAALDDDTNQENQP